MKIRKFLALFLALVLSASTLACTQEGGTTNDDTTPSDSIGDDTTPSDDGGIPMLPERDLEGFTLNMGKPIQAGTPWSTLTFAPLEETSDVLNDAIYRRNLKMMAEYNFELAEQELDDVLGTINQQILADDNDFDIYMLALNNSRSIASDDYLVNWYDVPNIELDEPWWDQDMQRDLDIGDGLFFMNSDMVFTIYDCTRILYYCKGLAEDLKLEDTYGKFYDIVNDGKWTVDIMHQLMSDASLDLDSDGAWTYKDSYGLMHNYSSLNGLFVGQGQNFAVIEDNYPVLDIQNDRFINVYENVVKLMQPTLHIDYSSLNYDGATGRTAIVTLFNNKQALFYENGISAAAQYMRDVEDVDFGFLPFPKYDENQEKYYTTVTNTAPVLLIPKTIPEDRLEKAGFVMEALSRESRESVVPEYFETCFSKKFVRDEESYNMIVLTNESRVYDLGLIYNYGSIADTITGGASSGRSGIASQIESIRTKAEAAIVEIHGERK